MTSGKGFGRSGVCGALFAIVIGFTAGDLQAQTAADGGNTSEGGQETDAIDRGKLRLELLIRLTENELEEATLSQSRLVAEAAELDQQRRKILAGPSAGTEEEARQIAVIEERLEQIDEEMALVNGRLPEIETELAELQARLDEANGIVRDPEAEADTLAGDANIWLDSKRQIQEALVYLGGYNALIDGDFGPRTREAVRVYQTRENVEATGTLTDEQEAALLSEAETLRARYGVKMIEDREVGYRLRYPSGLLQEESTDASGDRRFATKDGEGELVITSSEGDGAADLKATYDRLLADYEVQYRRQRGDWFVVAGLIDEGRIVYDTARLNGDRMIRARLSYPADWRDLWSPFAVIMFNSFEAVPSDSS